MSQFIANLESLRPDLEAALAKHATSPVNLEIVPNVALWAAGRVPGFTADPPGLALRAHDGSASVIVLRQEFTHDQAESIVARIRLGGHPQSFQLLEAAVQFARHLVLHELAHLENDWGQDREDECDGWAFQRLAHGA